jgi:SRSO17 transposase
LVRSKQKYVAEVHKKHRVWIKKPSVARRPYRKNGKKSRKTPRLASGSSKALFITEVTESPTLQQKRWTRWNVKETQKGPKIVECKTITVYPQNEDGLPSEAHVLLVVRDVRTEELKYFLCFAPVNTPIGLLLKVAYARWSVERCFEDSKKYIGRDHYEGRCYSGLIRQLIL